MLDTKILARELLVKNILNEPTLSLKELFEIRDSCLSLARYGLEDKDLLNETLKYISQKIGE